ncbi:Flp pilus assembly protein CpaB [Azospirillum brasilense]|uniref:Flp pilus assembly protein CpaB n=1 Tax=Azospirillum brasilense TaxID=192 RepID=UPI000E68B3F5|nr:Flp pilus assembly protein CpaB [Azospirillum brasilense]NUB25620.1 Flp pilus assembly protein CpaB [Azospirillum brasilense]NUB33602.1 Flp pilus assembly protein CpaB [Azospirillum brasilense]RIW00377.1 Flp pilus assembly protein CpaB [Azospirillum brasilense]
MAPRTILLSLAALALLGSGAILLALPGTQPPPAAAVPAPPALTKLRVAAHDLTPGTFIQDSDVRWQDWPQSAVLEEHVLSGSDKDPSIGAMVRHRIPAGEPLMRSRLIAPGERGFLAAVLSPGMRAISVAVTEVSGAAGLISPGDLVDLILTQALPNEQDNPARRLVGETVLERVRVIAVDQRVEEAAKDHNNSGNVRKVATTVTLEVGARQAEKVAVAAELGHLTLSLHSIAPAGEAVAPTATEPVWASDVSAALTGHGGDRKTNERPRLAVIRGTELVRQSF